jgi:HPt (histidine-containing phosphotransfer) domain-containing protein
MMSSRLVDVDGNADAESALFMCADDATFEAVDMETLNSFEEMRVEGEPDLIVELIDLYVESAPRQLAVMLEAAAERDEASLKRAAHCLKGSSASLGARRVAALCDEIEGTVYDSLRELRTLTSRLEHEFERARQTFVAERRRRL